MSDSTPFQPQPRVSAARRPIRWLLPFVVTLVGFEVLAFGGVYSWVWVPATIAALLALCLYCGILTWRRQRLPWFPLLYPVLGFGALVAWQWLTRASVYPGATLTGGLQLLGPAAGLYLAFCAFRRASSYRRLALVAWLFCGALALEAVFQHFSAAGMIYWVRDASYATPAGPFYYHNHFAGCMELLIPLAVAGALMPLAGKRGALPPLLLRCVLPLLGLSAVVISNSRGGVACMLLEAAVGFWLFRQSALRRPGLAFALVATVLGFALFTTWRPLLGRLESLRTTNQISAQDRLRLSESALAIWRDHAVFGAGFNTFAAIYPRYQKFDTGQQVQQAHDEYAQALAETGLVGIGFVLAFLVLFGHGYRAGPWGRNKEIDYVRRACLVGAIGFLVHSAFDFQFHAPANALLFFVVCAAAVGQPSLTNAHSLVRRVAVGSSA